MSKQIKKELEYHDRVRTSMREVVAQLEKAKPAEWRAGFEQIEEVFSVCKFALLTEVWNHAYDSSCCSYSTIRPSSTSNLHLVKGVTGRRGWSSFKPCSRLSWRRDEPT